MSEYSETPDENRPVPSEYDRTQDEKIAAKDAEIAELRAQLAQTERPGDAKTDEPAVDLDSGEAKFHEVLPPSTDEAAAPTLGDVPLTQDVEPVEFDPSPELSDSENPDTSSEHVQNTEELRAAVAEILVLTREIHLTVEWVKTQAPLIGKALQDSPFGKMLPAFFTAQQPF